MKPTFDGTLRLRPRINVPRGYGGNEPTSITLSAPLSRAITNITSSNTIYSGQPIIRDSEGGFILPGMTDPGTTTALDQLTDVQAHKIYFAYADSIDTDVLSANLLMGFSAQGKFEIESPWCDFTNLALGDKLQINPVNGLLEKFGAQAGEEAVGVVTEIRDLGVKGHTSLVNLDDANGAMNTRPNPRGGAIITDENGDPIGTIGEDGTSNVYDDLAGDTNTIKIVKFVTIG